MSRSPLQLTGQRFGRLKAIAVCDSTENPRRWICRCDCGSECAVRASKLSSGHTKSCGCLRKEKAQKASGVSSCPTYNVWKCVIFRCTKRGITHSRNYGDRGIQVCAEWVSSYSAFVQHIGERPGVEYELDRIDNNGNYEPGNVRWVTHKQNNRNRRNNRIVDAFGKSLCIAEWNEMLGLPRGLVSRRLDRGWTAELALSHPSRRKYGKDCRNPGLAAHEDRYQLLEASA